MQIGQLVGLIEKPVNAKAETAIAEALRGAVKRKVLIVEAKASVEIGAKPRI